MPKDVQKAKNIRLRDKVGRLKRLIGIEGFFLRNPVGVMPSVTMEREHRRSRLQVHGLHLSGLEPTPANASGSIFLPTTVSFL